MDKAKIFTTCAITLYVVHHVGDYWVQSDHDARHKGDVGAAGRRACTNHVLSYLITQCVLLLIVEYATDMPAFSYGSASLALAVSGLTHWTADRREHGLMFCRVSAARAGTRRTLRRQSDARRQRVGARSGMAYRVQCVRSRTHPCPVATDLLYCSHG